MARPCSTICLPIGKDAYEGLIHDPKRFRDWLDGAFRDCPELFPRAFADGYALKDDRTSARTGLRLRRVRLLSTGQSFSVRPSFVLPYMTALTDDVEKPLFLRAFGVPFWAIARVFGRDHGYWYRPQVSLGRNSIVGGACARPLCPSTCWPTSIMRPRDGVKNYIATTVGAGCCLGATLAQTAGAEDLRAAYEVFKQEAQNVQPDYKPQTVSVAGWAATRQAWQALFPLVALLRCFLHGWLNIRSRGKLSEAFAQLSAKVWDAYRAPSRRGLAQRLRRLWEWAQGRGLTGWLLSAGAEVVRSVKGVRRGVPPPRRAPDQ